jgi:hypothetical protein
MIRKVLAAISIVFIVYGYAARFIPIRFFWESKDIGWSFLIISLVLYLVQRVAYKPFGKKSLPEYIGIFGLSLLFVVRIILLSAISNDQMLTAIKEFVVGRTDILSETGEIGSYYVIPYGGISTTTNARGTAGAANFQLVIKGKRKYIEGEILLRKEPDSDWQVIDFRKLY